MREVTNLNIKKIIRSERGDVSYISTFVYILVAMIMVAFILNVFHIISVKQEMDHISDQLVKQIQQIALDDHAYVYMVHTLVNDVTAADVENLAMQGQYDWLNYQMSYK